MFDLVRCVLRCFDRDDLARLSASVVTAKGMRDFCLQFWQKWHYEHSVTKKLYVMLQLAFLQ